MGKALLEVTGHGLEVKKEVEVASADSIISLETTLVLGKKVKCDIKKGEPFKREYLSDD